MVNDPFTAGFLDELEKESALTSEVIGAAINPLNVAGGNLVGSLMAAGTKTRTTKEQAESNKDLLKNLLIPGWAAHNIWKRLGYSQRGKEVARTGSKK